MWFITLKSIRWYFLELIHTSHRWEQLNSKTATAKIRKSAQKRVAMNLIVDLDCICIESIYWIMNGKYGVFFLRLHCNCSIISNRHFIRCLIDIVSERKLVKAWAFYQYRIRNIITKLCIANFPDEKKKTKWEYEIAHVYKW